ncbi:MAG: hypothetical protein ACI9VM_000175 [Candidatus Azotimanducaceae bacterium]|jgi:hypothetical protein
MKEQVKPLYEELKGIRSAIPDASLFDDRGVSEKYHSLLDKLRAELPDLNTDEYKIRVKQSQRGPTIDTPDYKTKVESLIGNIKGRFDFDSTEFNNGHTFIQNQTVSVELVLNLQEKVIELRDKYKVGTPERSFLEKLKSSLSSIKDGADIIKIVLSEAKTAGLSVEKLISIFS